MSINGTFFPAAGLLSVSGDNLDNTISASRDAAGQILINGGAVAIDGGQPTVADTTEIVVTGGNGDDTISLGNAVLPPAQIFGGNGNDMLTGGAGADQLFGGNGNDTVIGGKGNDTAFLGNGDDTFIWNPGDGNDVVEGGNGFDTMDFRGANIGETIVISANGSRAFFARANGNMDMNGVERIQFEAQGLHPDNITINDLTGTDVKQIALDLGSGPAGGGDGQADTVTINTADPDGITITNNNGVIMVTGLASTVTISNFETGTDHLVINGQPVALAVASGNNTGAALLRQFMASSFVGAGDGHGGMPSANQQPEQQPLLANPHF